MITIKYNPADLRYIFLLGDRHELIELEKYLNKIPQYMFLPSFSGIPKPEVFLNKLKNKTGQTIYWCHSGLYKTIMDWCAENKIGCEGVDNNLKYNPSFHLSLEEFTECVSSWNLNITPRPYQIRAAWLILHYRQSLSQLATRAGKTLIAYMVFRWMLERGDAHNILMIVPNISLVKQAVGDLQEYKEFFSTETVWAKGEYCEGSNITIGTFQSLVKRADRRGAKYDPKWFDKFDVVLCDEAHHLICKSINTIMALPFMKGVKMRFGFTGTLPQEGTIESFCCHSLMGPTIQDLSPHELIDEGYLAKPSITQIRINYTDDETLRREYIRCGEYLCGNDVKGADGKVELLPKEERSFTMTHQKTLPYALREIKNRSTEEEYRNYLVDMCKGKGSNLLLLEQMIVHRSTRRLEVMRDILSGMTDKNCIVFGHHTEYLRYLRDYFMSAFPGRNVYLITGSTPLKSREKIMKSLETENGDILVASYGVVSTGITFKNMDYAILAQSFKSNIINLQSIGRLMLKTSEKDTFYLYDIIDCLPTKRLMFQGQAKVKIYKDQKFDYKIEYW